MNYILGGLMFISIIAYICWSYIYIVEFAIHWKIYDLKSALYQRNKVLLFFSSLGALALILLVLFACGMAGESIISQL